MSVLLISTYDLGRQPFGLASPAAWLKRAGFDVCARDVSRDKLDDDEVRRASLIAFYLPMHTATRLALPLIDRVRALNPSASVCAYGLYAPLSEPSLREHGVSIVLGPEAEEDLVTVAAGVERAGGAAVAGGAVRNREGTPPLSRTLQRLAFIRPERASLPPLSRYATLQMPDGGRKTVGATDATRGCKHRCRHCPVVPVYHGQFRVIPVDVVLADIEQQVAAGAEHITFGDPDFFNGPTHARRIVEALHARYPTLSYDVTIKVEHLLSHQDLLPLLAQTGCLFITSAVESVDDRILQKLEKGHTREDFFAVVELCRDAGVNLAPTFVAFTPWTTLEGYRDLLDTVRSLDLVDHVAPVQWGLRLLITHGSKLLELDDVRARVKPFNSKTLTYPWDHEDPRVDALQEVVMQSVGAELTRSRVEVFEDVSCSAGLKPGPPRRMVCVAACESGATTEFERPARATIPYLNEPWYC